MPITKEQIPRQNKSRLYNDIYVFAYAAPDYYIGTELYLASQKQESNQTHHPISQDAMLKKQLPFFSLPKDDVCYTYSDE